MSQPEAHKDKAYGHAYVDYKLNCLRVGDCPEGEWEIQIRLDDDGMYIHVQKPYGQHDWEATKMIPYDRFCEMMYAMVKEYEP